MQGIGGGGFFFVLIWILMMIATIVSWIIILVAFWRIGNAHERISWTLRDSIYSIASSIAVIAENTKQVEKGEEAGNRIAREDV
jgi:biopolymer transport protein ExbB/TolQ